MTKSKFADSAAGRFLRRRSRIAAVLGVAAMVCGVMAAMANGQFDGEPSAMVVADAKGKSPVAADPHYWDLQLGATEQKTPQRNTVDAPDPWRWRLGLENGRNLKSDDIEPAQDISEAPPPGWDRPLQDAVHKIDETRF